jgi:hypothetical protein
MLAVRVIMSRKMRWAEHVARMRELRNAYKILVAKPEGKKPHGRIDVVGKIILKWILRKSGLGAWIGFFCLGIVDGVNSENHMKPFEESRVI